MSMPNDDRIQVREAPGAPAALRFRVGDTVRIDRGRFGIERTPGGRLVLVAQDGSRAWIGDADAFVLFAAGRLSLLTPPPSRSWRDRRGAWAREGRNTGDKDHGTEAAE